MRLKSGIWVAAYIRRCQVEGAQAVLRRRGAEEAGAVFIKVSRLDGTADVYGPAPQSTFDEARPSDRAFIRSLKTEARHRGRRRGLSGAPDQVRSRHLDRRGRGPRRAQFSRYGGGVSLPPWNAGECHALSALRDCTNSSQATLGRVTGNAGALRSLFSSCQYCG